MRNGPHPAAEWAMQSDFDPVRVDCTTTVVLKILDNKCKMLPGEKAAVMAVYDVVKGLLGELFDARVHEAIAQARCLPDALVLPVFMHCASKPRRASRSRS